MKQTFKDQVSKIRDGVEDLIQDLKNELNNIVDPEEKEEVESLIEVLENADRDLSEYEY